MRKKKESTIYDKLTVSDSNDLFERIVSILEQAKSNVVRAVNSNMVLSYWLIGREIVQEVQGGDERAQYGKQIVEDLSKKLTEKYGKGFSTTNLWYLRQFYLVYSDREPIILHTICGELKTGEKLHKPCGVLDEMFISIENNIGVKGFSALLSWSHYRTLSKIENKTERLFYEIESEKEGWSVPVLERQIHTCLFARLIKSKDKKGIMNLALEGQKIRRPIDAIKDPYILDFLELPESSLLRESDLEKAIISNLQSFLLEIGKGFAFVSRQKRLQYEDEFFYIDLVFYNCILKCYLLIDLKMGKLNHQDVGQMDSYVRMFDELYLTEGDNPTIGLILCAEKNKTIARYSVLKESKQIFASKYKLYLPTEEELRKEIESERAAIELELKLKSRLSEEK